MSNKLNYNKEMKKVIEENCADDKEGKKSLLLHACCAPCSSSCVEKIRNYFDTTLYFFNPNITNYEEYRKRADELMRLVNEFNCDGNGIIGYAEGDYKPADFTSIAKGLEDCPERGERCYRCYELRLKETARYAVLKGFDYFSTTLTLSPLKDVEKLNSIGYEVAKQLGDSVRWLPSDFKKEGGYQRSIELSREHNLYRQDYCGCIYSKKQRELEIKSQSE